MPRLNPAAVAAVSLILQALALFGGQAAILLSTAWAQDPVALHGEMLRHRAAGNWTAAAELATAIVQVLETQDTPLYQLNTMRLERDTFQKLAALPGSKQEAALEAVRVEAQVERGVAEGSYCETVPLAQRQIELYRTLLGPRHYRTALSLTNLAVCLRLCGRIDEAYAVLVQGLDILRDTVGPEHPNVAMGEHSLALILYHRGALLESEGKAREALSIFQETIGPWHPKNADLLGLVGSLLSLRGDYAGAGDYFMQGLAIHKDTHGERSAPYATLQSDLAEMYLNQGNLYAAEDAARSALETLETELGPGHPEALRAVGTLAVVNTRRGDLALALKLREHAWNHQKAALGEDHPATAAAAYQLAMLKFRTGDLDGAEDLLVAARETHAAVFGELDWWSTHEHLALGHLQLLRGDPGAALEHLNQSARAYEFSRSLGGRGLVIDGLVSPYITLAHAHLELGRAADAWIALQQDQGRLLGPTASPVSDGASGELSALTRVEEALRQALRSRVSGQEFDRLLEQLNEAQQDWLARRGPRGSEETVSPVDVQGALGSGEAVVGWLDSIFGGEGRGYGYVIRPDGGVQWIPLKEAALSTVRECLEALAQGQGPSPEDADNQAGAWKVGALGTAAREIAEAMIHPLLPALGGVETVFVVPSLLMQSMPLCVLPTPEGQPLDTLFDLVTIPGARSLVELRSETEPRVVESALLLGDPPFSPRHVQQMEREAAYAETLGDDPADLLSAARGNARELSRLRRLPYTREEVRGLAELFARADVLLGEAASESAILERIETGRLEGYDVIHIASHAVLDDRQPDMSAVILCQTAAGPASSSRRGDDGLILARDMEREWRLSAELVTLSCCETGLGRTYAGQGHLGFAHALLAAGARSVLLTLWKVDDQATALFMKRFYRAWLVDGLTRAEALSQTRRWFREGGAPGFEDPSYWAAFTLLGLAG